MKYIVRHLCKTVCTGEWLDGALLGSYTYLLDKSCLVHYGRLALQYCSLNFAKLSVGLLITLLLNACALFGDPTPVDETKGWSVEKIYEAAQSKMRDGNYQKAISYFQKLESRYPNASYAAQAQLEIAFAYYKRQEPASSAAAADRFISLHPNHPNLDYAYYIKGLAMFNQRGIVQKLTRQEISDRDPQTLRASFAVFKELVTRFPTSRYEADATQRMIYLTNQLATHELHVARYYMKRRAYLAVVKRAQYVLEYYPNTPSVEEALALMVEAYDALGLQTLKADTKRVLEQNYPDRANKPSDS